MVSGGVLISLAISIAISFALSMVTGLVTKLLTKKPRKDTLGFDDRTDTALGVVDPQQFFFGELRKGGTIIYKRTTSDRQNMWIVVAIAGHEVESLDELWLGNDHMRVSMNDGSVANSSYNGKVECFFHLGTATQTVDTNLQAVFPDDWTLDHKLAGIAYATLHFIFDTNLYGGGVPNPSFKGRGYNQIFDPRTAITGYSDNPILCSRAYLENSVFGINVDVVQEVDDGVVASEASTCDEQVLIPQFVENFTPVFIQTYTVVVATDVFTVTSTSELLTGDPVYVYVTGAGVLAVPLVAGTVYYARIISATTLSLHPTVADALANTNKINITTNGTAPQKMVGIDTFKMLGNSTTFTANAGTDVLTLAAHIFSDSANFPAVCILSSTATLPSPYVATTKYVVYFSTSTTLVSAITATIGGTNVDILTAGSGTHTLTVIGHLLSGQVINGLITIGTPRPAFGWGALYAGKPVRYHDSDNGLQKIEQLTDLTTYFLIPLDASAGTFSVATTAENARRGLAITLSDKRTDGTTQQTGRFETLEVSQDEMLNALTGTAVSVNACQEDTTALPTGLSKLTTYAFIYVSRGRFKLASSQANAFANVAVIITDGGADANSTYALKALTDRRYATCGVFDADQEYGDVLKGLLSACAGRYVPPGDKWLLYAGSWRVPLMTLDRGSIRSGGNISLQLKTARRDLVNTVQGTYASPINFDQPSNFPTVVDSTAIAEDGDQTLSSDILLPFTGSKWTAVRLALIEERRGRYQKVLAWGADVGLYEVTVNDTVQIDFAELNIADAFFEVASIEFGIENSDDGDGPILIMDFTLRETHPFIYMTVLGFAA